MQRILKITIKSRKDYDDGEIFSYEIASVLRKFIRPVSIKKSVSIKAPVGEIATKNNTTMTWKHFYKEES